MQVMKNWFLKLKIRVKLLLAFGSILLMSVLIISVGINTIQKMISYNRLVGHISSTNVVTLKLNGYIQEFSTKGFKDKQFLETSNSELLESYYTNYDSLMSLQKEITNHEFFTGNERGQILDSLNRNFGRYNKYFQSLLSVYIERGFKDYGVEGTLREAIHDVEDSSFPYDKATMLMLRRHEKDFFLRKDLKYLDRFNNTIAEFETSVDTITTQDIDDKEAILNHIEKYKSKFNYIVELEEKIGLSSTTGILGNLSDIRHSIQNQINYITKIVNDRNDDLVANSMVILISLLCAQLIIGFILIHFYSSMLTKAIKELRRAIVTLSDGEFPDKMIIRTRDEIGDTKTALNQFVDRIKSAVSFASNLGKGQLRAEYPEEYKNDVLAKAILSMQEQLIDADEQQSTINWTNEGMARFSDILKNESEDVGKISDDIIAQMVHYLEVNQGALYILDVNDNELTRLATYAYGKKKFADHKVTVGQGLVGQCVLEKSTIHITDVPTDYVKITSGLGEATPTNLLIVPLKIRDEVMGVIELASFTEFSKNKVSFVEKVSENIANILLSKQKAVETEKLLKESQEKAEMLSSQEEELRQNSEELQATQEDMERQRKDLMNEISDLKSALEQKNKTIIDLNQQLKENLNDLQLFEELKAD